MKVTIRFIFILFLLINFFAVGQNESTINDLPLRAFPSSKNQGVLFIYFTGDGGWNNFSQQLAERLNNNNPVVVFDSRKYFWNAKTPDIFAGDVQRVIDYYRNIWKLDKVAIVGYSFGADVAAFLPARLKSTTSGHLLPMVLLSPSYSSDFEVKLSDLLGSSSKVERKYNVQDALLKGNFPVLCVFGEDEDLYLKESLGKLGKVKIKEIPGSHRYGNNVELITDLILATVKQ